MLGHRDCPNELRFGELRRLTTLMLRALSQGQNARARALKLERETYLHALEPKQQLLSSAA